MPECQYCLRKGFFIKMFSSKNQHGYIKERFSVTLYCIVCCYIFWQFLKKSPQMLFEERFSGNCCLEERGPHRPAANTNAPFNLLPKLLSFSILRPKFFFLQPTPQAIAFFQPSPQAFVFFQPSPLAFVFFQTSPQAFVLFQPSFSIFLKSQFQ